MFVLDYHVCYRWAYPGTTALGPVPPWEIPVSLLSQCQSHWLTWILSLLCSYCFILIYAYKHTVCTASANALASKVIVCILYPAGRTTEQSRGGGGPVRDVLTCHSGGVKSDVSLMLWCLKQCCVTDLSLLFCCLRHLVVLWTVEAS